MWAETKVVTSGSLGDASARCDVSVPMVGKRITSLSIIPSFNDGVGECDSGIKVLLDANMLALSILDLAVEILHRERTRPSLWCVGDFVDIILGSLRLLGDGVVRLVKLHCLVILFAKCLGSLLMRSLFIVGELLPDLAGALGNISNFCCRVRCKKFVFNRSAIVVQPKHVSASRTLGSIRVTLLGLARLALLDIEVLECAVKFVGRNIDITIGSGRGECVNDSTDRHVVIFFFASLK